MAGQDLELGFWFVVLTLLTIGSLGLIPYSLGNVINGRVSGISVLVLFYYLYSVPFLADYFLGIIDATEFPAEFIPTLKVKALGFVGIFCGIAFASLMGRGVRPRSPISFEKEHLYRLLIVSVILSLVSIPIIVMGFQVFGGFSGLLSMERGARFTILRERFDLLSIGVFYLLQAGAILATFVLTGYMSLKIPSRAKVSPVVICLLIVLASLFLNIVALGVRSYPLSLVIIFLIFFTTNVKRIRAVWILGFLGLLFVIFGAVALVREITVAEVGVSEARALTTPLPKVIYSLSYNDPGIVFRTSSDILGYYSSGGELFYGKTYAEGIVGLIPSPVRSAMGIGDIERISEWVSRMFAEKAALLGGFRAVSSDSEALINFGLVGVLLVHFLLFLGLSLMEIYVTYSPATTLVVLPVLASYSFILRKAFDLNIHNVFYVIIFTLVVGVFVYGDTIFASERS